MAKVKDILNYYYLVNVLVMTRKDGRVIRDVMGSGWFKRWDDTTYTSMLAATNAKYQNTALIACDAAVVDAYQDDCEYCNDNGYPQPDLQGWFVVWVFGDVRRDEIAARMRYC